MLIESFDLIERLEKVTPKDFVEIRALKAEVKNQSEKCKHELCKWIPLSEKNTFGAFIVFLFAFDGISSKETRIAIYDSWLCDQECLNYFKFKYKPGSAVELHAYCVTMYLDLMDLFK